MNGPALLIVIAALLLLLILIAAWVDRVSNIAWLAARRAAKAERIAKGAVVLADVLEQSAASTHGGGPRHSTGPPVAPVRQLRRDVARHPVRATAAAAVLIGLFVVAPLALSERDTDAAPPYEPIPPRPTGSGAPTTTTVTVTVTGPGAVGPAGPKGEPGEPGPAVNFVGAEAAGPPRPPSSSSSAPPARSEPAPPPSSTNPQAPAGEPVDTTQPCVPPLTPPACVANPQLGG